MRTVPLIIALLTLYFSIGDIFGEKRISQIESKWLVLSDRVFKNWKLVFDNYKYWFLLLLFRRYVKGCVKFQKPQQPEQVP